MSNHILRDKDYKRIGAVNDLQNGNQEVRDSSNHRLGYYDPDRDCTFDAAGRLVGRGNLMAMLLNR